MPAWLVAAHLTFVNIADGITQRDPSGIGQVHRDRPSPGERSAIKCRLAGLSSRLFFAKLGTHIAALRMSA